MFNNLKVGTKLLAAFVLVALLGTVIGGVGIRKIHQIEVTAGKLYILSHFVKVSALTILMHEKAFKYTFNINKDMEA